MWALLLLLVAAYAQPSIIEKLAPIVKAPLVVKEFVLGKTALGKPLTVCILAKGPFAEMGQLQGRKAVLLNSYMHARQPYSLQLMQGLAIDIATKGEEGDVGEFLQQQGVFLFYPFVNPDGYQLFTQTGNIDVRKNSNTGGMRCPSGLPGVDINRNFPANFGIIPQSSRPCSEEYHGKAPFSQSQALVFKQLFDNFHILIAIDIHSYGNEWIYPYASDPTGKLVQKHPLFTFYRSIKNELTARRRRIHSCIQSLGYIADGVYIDWALDQGALSFAFQVGTTFHSDRQAEIQRDIKAGINDFHLIFKKTLPRYGTKTTPKSLLVISQSLSSMNITVYIRNRTEYIQLSPGEEVEVGLQPSDTSATITNNANNHTQVLSLRLRNLDSLLTPNIVIFLIVAILLGLILSFYIRWQGLRRRYSDIIQHAPFSEQQLPSSERQQPASPSAPS